MRALVRFVVVLAVLAALVGGAAAWMGVLQVPVLSASFGMDHPRDLGSAQPDEAAYASFSSRLGVKLPSPAANYSFSSRHEFSGSVAVNETIQESTVLAIREFQTDTDRKSVV